MSNLAETLQPHILETEFEDQTQQVEPPTILRFADYVENLALQRDQTGEIREALEQDIEHGKRHVDRVLSWNVDFNVRSELAVEMPYFHFYSFAAVTAIKRHDLVETVAKYKERHRHGAAKYSLGIDTIIEENFEKYDLSQWMTKDQWRRLKWATAFMCLYHHPEGMPSTDQIMERGYLIDVNRVYERSKPLNNRFEPYRGMQHVFGGLLQEPQPDFSREEIEAIRMNALLVAAADKMDQLVPTEVSSNRMLQLNPGRRLYQRQQHKNIDKELDSRIEKGSHSQCPDDLSRVLFEICRTRAFDEAPEIVREIYTKALREKAYYLRDAILGFLDKDFSRFVAVYDDLELAAADDVLDQFRYTQQQRENILQSPKRMKTIHQICKQRGYPTFFENALETIRGERAVVWGALNEKYKIMVHDKNLDEQHRGRDGWPKRRIKELLDAAITRMEADLNPDWVGPVEKPYISYHGVNVHGDSDVA